MTQEEANELIAVLKLVVSTLPFMAPQIGQSSEISLKSAFSNVELVVYLNRKSRLSPSKYSFVLKVFEHEVLLRLDLGQVRHVNPDGEVVDGSHLHVWRGDRRRCDVWAIPLPTVFDAPERFLDTLREFLQYCNVKDAQTLALSEQFEMG